MSDGALGFGSGHWGRLGAGYLANAWVPVRNLLVFDVNSLNSIKIIGFKFQCLEFYWSAPRLCRASFVLEPETVVEDLELARWNF